MREREREREKEMSLELVGLDCGEGGELVGGLNGQNGVRELNW